jgi:hypothetical protein
MSDEEYDKPISQLPEKDRLEVFKDWLKLSRESFSKQRERERDDLLFQFPENQWPPEALERKKAGKPMIAISLIQGPLQYVYNQAAAARFGVDLKPLNENSKTKLAEVKKGLYERGQRDGEAQPARMWAFDRASQAGMGWYRINTKYDEDSDNPSDQEICYERILFQEMIFPDPAAIKADFSDGRFLFAGAYVHCRDFKRQYPRAKFAKPEQFGEISEKEPDWVRAGSKNEPFIAEVFYKESSYEPIDVEGEDEQRLMEIVEVRRAVITALEILEDKLWLKDKKGRGRKYIPFIPMIGVEKQPVDGERRWEGMTRGARDGQYTFNWSISKTLETVAKENTAQYLVLEGQVDGYENEWNNMNKNNRAWLPYRNVTLDGKPAGPPILTQVDGTKMLNASNLAQLARELVQTAMQGFEPMEQPRNKAEQSGRAILALEQKADAGRSHYIQNAKDISLPLDARIWLDAAPVVYDRKGRVLHILGLEEETEPVMIGAHYVIKNGMPVQVPPGTPDAEFIDLTEGRYAIVPVMGKAPQTRLQEGQEFMAEIIKAAPEMLGKVGDLLFKWRDEPGAKQMAERMKRVIQMTSPGLIDDPKGAQDTQAELQATKQQLQMVSQQAQEMADMLKTEAAKQQAQVAIAQAKSTADVEIERMKAAMQVEIQGMKNAGALAVAEFNARAKGVQITTEAMTEAAMLTEEQEHETHEHREEMAHEVAMAAAGGNTMKRTVDRGQEQDQEQSQEQGGSGSASQDQSHETGPAPQADGAGE